MSLSNVILSVVEDHVKEKIPTAQISSPVTGENPTVQMVHVKVGDETYLVVVKRIGG